VALDYGWEEAAEGDAEVAGGEVLAGEEIGYVAAEFVGGLGLGLFAGVEGAEMEMGGGMRATALATVGEGEGAEIGAVLGGVEDIDGSRDWGFGILKKSRQDAGGTKIASLVARRNTQWKKCTRSGRVLSTKFVRML